MAEGLRNERNDGAGKARAEDEDNEKRLCRDNDGRKLRGTEPANEDDVGRMDRHLRQLRADKRDPKSKRGAQMSRPRAFPAFDCDRVERTRHFKPR
ncbi:hypothetical protein D3C87_1513350 [compost metagenome]